MLPQTHPQVEGKELIEFQDIDAQFTFIFLPFLRKFIPDHLKCTLGLMFTIHHFKQFLLKCGIFPFIIELAMGPNCFNWKHSWHCDFIKVAVIDMAVNYKHMICLPGIVKSEGKKEELTNLLMRFDDLHN